MALTILFDNSTKKFSVGTTSSADTGDLRIYYNGTQFYDNWGGATNDIVSGSANSAPSIPLTSDGNIKKGVYKFEYKESGSLTLTESAETSFVLDPVKECIDLSYDCFTPTLSAADSTSYNIDNSAVVDSITRTLTAKYPTGSSQPDVVASASGASSSAETLSINSDNLWTGAYNITLVGEVTYTVSPTGYSAYTYYEEINGYDSIIAECNNDLCDIYCCLNGLFEKLTYAQNKNRDQYDSLLSQYNYATSLLSQYKTAVECGKTTGLDTLIAKMKDVLNCDGCGCQECNDEPSKRVYGIGSSNASSITVTDGTTTVTDVSQITVSGASVTNEGAGEAKITVSGGGGSSSLTETYVGFGGVGDVLSGSSDFTYDATNKLAAVEKFQGNFVIQVENNTGSTLVKGTPVYIVAQNSAQIRVAPADATIASGLNPAVALIMDDITSGNTGYAASFGKMTISDTLFDVAPTNPTDLGQEVYLSSTAGQLTFTKPTASTEHVQHIGSILRITGSNIEVLIEITGDVATDSNATVNQLATNTSNIATNTANITTLQSYIQKVSKTLTGAEFDQLSTVRQQIITGLPAAGRVLIHSASLTLLDTIDVASTTFNFGLVAGDVVLSTTNSLAVTPIIGGASQSVSANQYTPLQVPQRVGLDLGSDIYISADADPSDWTPDAAVIDVYYSIVS